MPAPAAVPLTPLTLEAPNAPTEQEDTVVSEWMVEGCYCLRGARRGTWDQQTNPEEEEALFSRTSQVQVLKQQQALAQ